MCAGTQVDLCLTEVSTTATVNGAGGALPYRLFKPRQVLQGATYPLVVFLHGAGERGADNEAQLVHGIRNILRFSVEENAPCYLVAPQCPACKWWDGVTRNGEGNGDVPVLTVLSLVDDLMHAHSIDPMRIYVTGLSMGGFGTWKALALRPAFFAAGVPVCGGGSPDDAAAIADVPQWAFHGTEDDVVPPVRSREMVDALRAVGARPGYTEFPGVGHDSWDPAYRDRTMLRWMFMQHRRL